MPYRHVIDRCFAEAAGVSDDDFRRRLDQADGARRRLAEAAPAFLDVPTRRKDLKAIAASAGHYRERFRYAAILGTGGSSLGGQSLVALVQNEHAGRPQTPRLIFVDNADPDSLTPLLTPERLAETGFVAISKSGGTAETMAQLLLVVDAIRTRQSRAALETRLTLVTQPGDSPMRRLARQFALPVVDHPADVGGRFSALTVSGLLPTMIAGLDGAVVRAGAAAVVESLKAGAVADCAPAVGAALAAAQADAGLSQSVLMPYGDRLRPFALWWRQLWAESLGKGGRGTTPIASVGAVDQHSQLQLYLDGPNDKAFTLLGAEGAEPGPAIPADLCTDGDIGYLGGRTLGDLLTAMRRATADTLAAAGRPVRELAVERLDGGAMGALMMHYMIETALTADLFGVDPYDQPAVEDGKVRARRYLAGTGEQ